MEPLSEPRWLDAEERQTWLALVSVLIRMPAALDAQLRRDAGISHFEYQVMAVLSEAPDRTMRISDPSLPSPGRAGPRWCRPRPGTSRRSASSSSTR